MVAEVYLETNRSEKAYVVEKSTVLEDENGSFVFVERDGIANKVNVETGLENGKFIEILGEIADGEKVIVKGQHYVGDQDSVQVK